MSEYVFIASLYIDEAPPWGFFVHIKSTKGSLIVSRKEQRALWKARKKWGSYSFLAMCLLLFWASPAIALDGGDGIPHIAWVTPFMILLGSIAGFGFISYKNFGHHWHHDDRIKAAWAIFLATPVCIGMFMIGGHAEHEMIKVMVEYPIFIVYVGGLFILSCGMFIDADIKATPGNNVLFLLVGSILASMMGTPGASVFIGAAIFMTNQQRTHVIHTAVFCILMVSNCGGLLTPLGDPPLFMGFQEGVPFFWNLKMTPEWLYINGMLLTMYWAMDRYYYSKESLESLTRDVLEERPLKFSSVMGLKFTIPLFIAFILTIVFVPTVNLKTGFYWPIREVVMLVLAAASFMLASSKLRNPELVADLKRLYPNAWKQAEASGRDYLTIHDLNNFNWAPITEVAALFIGIFICMAPAIVLVEHHAPEDASGGLLYALTGLFSSFLDNAPTYLIFFKACLNKTVPGYENVVLNSGDYISEYYLHIVSAGAVFCGALTYIGNAANFVTKALAEGFGVKMPSFFGYVLWAVPILTPVVIGIYGLFYSGVLWAQIVTGIASLLVVISAVLFGRRYPLQCSVAAQTTTD